MKNLNETICVLAGDGVYTLCSGRKSLDKHEYSRTNFFGFRFRLFHSQQCGCSALVESLTDRHRPRCGSPHSGFCFIGVALDSVPIGDRSGGPIGEGMARGRATAQPRLKGSRTRTARVNVGPLKKPRVGNGNHCPRTFQTAKRLTDGGSVSKAVDSLCILSTGGVYCSLLPSSGPIPIPRTEQEGKTAKQLAVGRRMPRSGGTRRTRLTDLPRLRGTEYRRGCL